jgi:hypothetical protein
MLRSDALCFTSDTQLVDTVLTGKGTFEPRTGLERLMDQVHALRIINFTILAGIKHKCLGNLFDFN